MKSIQSTPHVQAGENMLIGKDRVYVYKMTSGLYVARSIVFDAACVDYNPDVAQEKLFFALSNQHIDLQLFSNVDVKKPVEITKRRKKSEDADDLIYIYETLKRLFVAHSCFFHQEGKGSTRDLAVFELNNKIGDRLLKLADRDRSEPVAMIDVEVPIRDARVKVALFN